MASDALDVVVSGGFSADEMMLITAAAPDATVEFVAVGDPLETRIATADCVAGHVSAEALMKAPKLRWVHSWAAGPDSALHPQMIASPVILTSSKGNGAIPLAEQAILLMMLLNRDGVRWLQAQQNHSWDRFTHGELAGLTCGIVGLGNSGIDLARKAKAFHMHVIGVRRQVDLPAPFVDEVLPLERLHDLLAASDFVVVTAPRTNETAGMFGEPEFQAMRREAYFVCISRGGIADDSALLRALNEGWIAGAGLDAHGKEPLPADSPFWTSPHTIITPHNGATTPGTRRRGVEIFAENLRRFQAGEPLLNIVDKAAGY